MNRRQWVSWVGLAFLIVSCRSAPSGPAPRDYTLVLLKTGPQSGKLPKEENQKVFAGHFSNMERLANERKLLVAGPYGKGRSDAMLRGVFVLDSKNRAEATAWAETDPPTQAGVFVLEYHDLRTTAPLARGLEAELARSAKEKAEGHVAKPGEHGRAYVLLTAEHGDMARRELADLIAAKSVVLFADLDDTRALVILDAKDLVAARELLGARAEQLGAHTLDEWFASDLLVELARG